MVLETSVLSIFNQLTRLEARENFIKFSRRESFKSYKKYKPYNILFHLCGSSYILVQTVCVCMCVCVCVCVCVWFTHLTNYMCALDPSFALTFS
jgi:hypothetical protein